MFNKILIANRGEIAVRIQKACRSLGIKCAAVYSDDDINSLHVRLADEAYHIGPSQASLSYLNFQKIIDVAKEIGADAIHPGYGFLSENSNFIKAVESAGITFIGPSAKSVQLMGQKTAARKLMIEHNVPVVPGTTEPLYDYKEAIKIADEIGYPVMLKASAGGGGKGMRKVNSSNEIEAALEKAQSEAGKSFGDSSVYIEKFIENPKHIEVQIIGDKFGNYAHLYERECSVQRRHQKVVEESPSAVVDDKLRDAITESAIKAAQACGYYNAGTIEFLLDENKNFYFLEMNTRLQVEHPVTEMITGIDLVNEQISVAAGNKLSFSQKEIIARGHAVECRIYAEDADNNFAPSIGKIKHHRLPSGPGIRVDRGIERNSEVSVYYDPMLSKLVAWGRDRQDAISKLIEALRNYQISGVKTNIPFCKWILSHPKFLDGSFNINFIENEFIPLQPDKWKQNYADSEIAAIIISTVLKNSNRMNKAQKIDCNPSNKWGDLNNE